MTVTLIGKPLKQIHGWTLLDLKRAKSRAFHSKRRRCKSILASSFNRNFPNIFSEDVATSDQIYWMGLFNTYKATLHEGTKIVDQLQDGQTFKEAVVYTVDVSEQETK